MNTFKKIICICTVLMMSLSLAACSDNNKKNKESLSHDRSSASISSSVSPSMSETDNTNNRTNKIKTYYEQQSIDVDDNLKIIKQIMYSDDKLYLLGQKTPEKNGSESNDYYINTLNIITCDGKPVKSIDLPGGYYDADMTVTSDGTAYVLINHNFQKYTGNGPVEITYPEILCIKKDGTVSTIYQGEKHNLTTEYFFSADSKGDLCLSPVTNSDDGIMRIEYISGTGKQTDMTYEADGFIKNIICHDDEFYIQFYSSEICGYQFLKVDKEKLTISKYNKADINFSDIIDGSNGYDLYYPSASYIYGYNLADGVSEKIFSWFESDVLSIPNGDENIAVADNENVYFFNNSSSDTQYSSENGSEICPAQVIHLKKADQTRLNELNSLDMITLAGTDLYNSFFQVIQEFNKNNKDRFVMVTDYSQYDCRMEEDTQKELNALKTDIANEDIPDVILGNMSFDVLNNLSKDSFADLNPFLRNDPEINSNDLAENILKSCSYNGKLCMIPHMTSLQTLTVAEENTDNKEMFTYDEFFSLLDEFSDKPLMYPSEENVLEFLIPAYLEENIDFQKGTSNFDTDLFKKILEKTKAYVLKDKEYMFTNDGQLRPEYPLDRIEYRFAGEFYAWINKDNGRRKSNTVKGIPSSSNTASLMNVTLYMCMAESSENKEGAWNFIKYFNSINDTGSPMEKGFSIIHSKNQKCIDIIISELFSEPERSGPEAQRYRDAIDNLWNGKIICKNYYSGITRIITEQADKYYDGVQSLDYTVSAIQSKVTLYLSETG